MRTRLFRAIVQNMPKQSYQKWSKMLLVEIFPESSAPFGPLADRAKDPSGPWHDAKVFHWSFRFHLLKKVNVKRYRKLMAGNLTSVRAGNFFTSFPRLLSFVFRRHFNTVVSVNSDHNVLNDVNADVYDEGTIVASHLLDI